MPNIGKRRKSQLKAFRKLESKRLTQQNRADKKWKSKQHPDIGQAQFGRLLGITIKRCGGTLTEDGVAWLAERGYPLHERMVDAINKKVSDGIKPSNIQAV